jgi:hypothetical protein
MATFYTDPTLAQRAVVQPFDPMEAQSKYLGLRNQQQQGQLQGLQIQQAQQEQADQQKIRDAFQQAGGDWDKTFELAATGRCLAANDVQAGRGAPRPQAEARFRVQRRARGLRQESGDRRDGGTRVQRDACARPGKGASGVHAIQAATRAAARDEVARPDSG